MGRIKYLLVVFLSLLSYCFYMKGNRISFLMLTGRLIPMCLGDGLCLIFA